MENALMASIRLQFGDSAAIDVVVDARADTGASVGTAHFQTIGEHDAALPGESAQFINHAQFHSNSGGLLKLNGRSHRWRAIREDDRLDVWMDGRIHRFRIVPRTARRSGQAGPGSARAELTAPMPGTILRIAVREGDHFDAGTPLIIMESMKMEMTITSPVPGKVEAILCAEGDLVRINQILLRRAESESQ